MKKYMRKTIYVSLAALFWLVSANNLMAQDAPEKLNWVQGGNCWVAAPGFLYCGKLHPYVEDNPHSFVSFACFETYQAVLLSHPGVDNPARIRTVTSDFGHAQFSDIWVAATPTEAFMSSHVSPGNDGYFNTLRGLGSASATAFRFQIDQGEVSGVIELTGEEYLTVGAYRDLCNAQMEQ